MQIDGKNGGFKRVLRMLRDQPATIR